MGLDLGFAIWIGDCEFCLDFDLVLGLDSVCLGLEFGFGVWICFLFGRWILKLWLWKFTFRFVVRELSLGALACEL